VHRNILSLSHTDTHTIAYALCHLSCSVFLSLSVDSLFSLIPEGTRMMMMMMMKKKMKMMTGMKSEKKKKRKRPHSKSTNWLVIPAGVLSLSFPPSLFDPPPRSSLCLTLSLSLSHTHTHTHSLTRSLTYSLVDSLAHSPVRYQQQQCHDSSFLALM
jgi:hypothetical protein